MSKIPTLTLSGGRKRNYAPYVILVIMYLCMCSSVFTSSAIIPPPIGYIGGLSWCYCSAFIMFTILWILYAFGIGE